MKKLFLFALLSIFIPLTVHAQTTQDYDVAATVGSITFVPLEIHSGEQTRIYGSIVNVGRKDISGYIGFYQGVILLGKPQPFSLKANGVPEEFWVDWVPTEGVYNIMMTVIETDPADQNPGNNVAITRMMTITKRPPPVPLAPSAPPQVLPQVAPAPAVVIPTEKKETIAPSDKITTVPQKKLEEKKFNVPKPTPKVALKHFTIPSVASTTPLQAASSTPVATPLAAAFSMEFTKSVGLFKSEESATSTSILQVEKPEPVAQGKDSSSSSGVLVGAIIAVLLFLIGLLFLKKSKPE